MREFMGMHQTEMAIAGSAVGLAAVFVGAYAYGALDRGDGVDTPLVVIFALMGLFYGWLMFALLGPRPRRERGVGGR